MYNKIRLDVNKITDTGAEILSNLVNECTELQLLSLSCNHIGNKGAMALACALVANHSLIELDLQCNAIGDEGAVAIAEAVKDFPNEFQLLLWNINITPEGQAKVLKYKQTAIIHEEMTEHTWRTVGMDSPLYMVHTLRFIYQHSNIAYGKTFGLSATEPLAYRPQVNENLNQLFNQCLGTSAATLESLDLMSLSLGREEILALTNSGTLSDLKILKIKFPLNASNQSNDSSELLRQLSFKSKNLEQVHYKYCEYAFESHKQSLSHLLESFECEIVAPCSFPENILSNLNVSLSRVISFLCLSSLILVNCNIDDHGVQVLSQKKSDTKIQTLRLDFNKITDVGAACIAGLVRECAGLLHLSLSYNHIGDQGAMTIAGVAGHNIAAVCVL